MHAAGEVVPAFEVLDAVGSGVAEMGHTAAFYWQGKQPAAVFYTTVPFGLTPAEHVAWIDAGGRQFSQVTGKKHPKSPRFSTLFKGRARDPKIPSCIY